jgi:hypothetical protein
MMDALIEPTKRALSLALITGLGLAMVACLPTPTAKTKKVLRFSEKSAHEATTAVFRHHKVGERFDTNVKARIRFQMPPWQVPPHTVQVAIYHRNGKRIWRGKASHLLRMPHTLPIPLATKEVDVRIWTRAGKSMTRRVPIAPDLIINILAGEVSS